MSEILFPAFYILLSLAQFLFAGFVYVSNRERLANRAVAALLLILGLSNLSIGFQTTALTLESAEPWLWLRLIAARLAGPAVFLASVAILRPNLYKRLWFRLPFLIIIAVAPIAVLLDITNISHALFGTSLLYAPLDPSLDPASLQTVSSYAGGLLNPFYFFIVIFLPTLTIFFPALYVVLQDRKRAPAHSRMALFIFFATLIPGILQFLAQITVSTIVIFLSSLILTIGFVYIALRYSDSPVSMQRLSKSIAGWSMFSKLMVIPLAVVLPAVLIISVIALSFLQRNTLQLLGSNLHTLAATESRTVGGEIEGQVNSLTTLSQDPLLSFLVTFRETIYTSLDEEGQEAAVAAREEEWRAAGGDLNQPLLRVLLSPGRSFFLQDYKDVFPLHTDLVVTDFLGGLITATFTPESYDQSQFEWWQQAFNNGAGEIFIGSPEFDPEVGQFIVNIAVPIFKSSEDTQASGVLLSRYSLAAVNAELDRVVIGERGGVGLFNAQGEWLPTEGAMTEEDPNLNWDRLVNADQNWQVMPYGGEDSIVGWAELAETVEMDQFINLRVASYSPLEEALAPVNAARNGTIALTFLIILGSVIITAVIARQITRPLGELTQVAERILEGETDVKANIEGRDEIGTLASTFNAMTTQLRGLVSGLEQTVEDRTKEVEKRALQLETASEVAREAASIRDVSRLLEQVTHLISDRFGFYHAGIFLLDEKKEYSILQAASSPGGFRMLERGHKLQVGKVGVVGFAAGEGQPRLAQDVGADVIYYDNPDMPDTRSELAMPLKIRDEVIGVLDVQSMESNAFSREDVQILQTMADQIAVAIDNARLLQSSEKALSDLEALYGQESREAWQKRAEAQPRAYSYSPSGISVRSQADPNQMRQPAENGSPNRLTKDLVFRGEVIGSIDLSRDDRRIWSEDDLALVDEILEQTGLALENARLVEQIRLRSDQIQLLQEITAIAATILDEKELLEAVTSRLLRGLDLLNCSVLLFDATQNEGTLVADVFAPGSSTPKTLSGTTLPLENNEVTLEVIRTKQTVVLYDVPENPRAKQIEALAHHKDIQSLAIVPLIIGDDVIGVIGLSIRDASHRFTEEDLALLDQISAQISTAINVARLFEAEQMGRQSEANRAERERLVASITAKVRASNDPQEILQTAVNELRQALGARQAQVLIEPDSQSSEYPAETKSLDGNGFEPGNSSTSQDEDETQP